MTPIPENPYDALERHIVDLQQTRQRAARPPTTRHASEAHPDIEALASLAQQLQSAPALHVDSAFARRLERRVLARHAALQRSRATRKGWNWGIVGLSPARSVVVLALSLVLVVVIMGTSILTVAAQVSDPNNPLYAIKHWEQQVQVSLASSAPDQAELHLKFAREQLETLGNFTDVSKSSSYQRAIANFDQQVTTAAQEINALPSGADHDRLSNELTTLQMNARQTLRGLLGKLTLTERLLTTDELGRLGDTVPSLTQAQVTLPAQPNGQATVDVVGSNLQAGAQLLVDGQPVEASGTLQNGGYRFTATWRGDQHPHSIGILNPDGTAAQTTQVSVQTTNTNNGNGSGSCNGNGNGSGSGNGNGNGSGKGKGNGNGNGNGSGNCTGSGSDTRPR